MISNDSDLEVPIRMARTKLDKPGAVQMSEYRGWLLAAAVIILAMLKTQTLYQPRQPEKLPEAA